MPGAPPRASTANPESSASAGRPEARAAWRALRMAFSTKLRPVSSASWSVNSRCGSTSMSSERRPCNSLSLPALLLASTNLLKGRAALLIRMELLLEAHRVHRGVVVGLHLPLVAQQPALSGAVVGNEVDGNLCLNANEAQWCGLLQQVGHGTLDPGIHDLHTLLGQPLHGDIDHALARAALQPCCSSDLRLQVGTGEGVVMRQQVAE